MTRADEDPIKIEQKGFLYHLSTRNYVVFLLLYRITGIRLD